MTRGSCTVAMNPGCAWVAPGTTFCRDVQVRARKGREYRGSCATHNQKVADSNPAPAITETASWSPFLDAQTLTPTPILRGRYAVELYRPPRKVPEHPTCTPRNAAEVPPNSRRIPLPPANLQSLSRRPRVGWRQGPGVKVAFDSPSGQVSIEIRTEARLSIHRSVARAVRHAGRSRPRVG